MGWSDSVLFGVLGGVCVLIGWMWRALYDEARAARDEERIAALLRQVEWAGPDEYDPPTTPACPLCKAQRPDGHESDCRLAAALEER